jgi:16S rRNA (guanine527-N7)-methyltransferase
VTVVHQRVEDHRGQYPAIVSRAFASLADFVRLTRHLLAPGGCWLAMKARSDPAETRALPADVRLARRLPLEVPGLDEQRQLLELRIK